MAKEIQAEVNDILDEEPDNAEYKKIDEIISEVVKKAEKLDRTYLDMARPLWAKYLSPFLYDGPITEENLLASLKEGGKDITFVQRFIDSMAMSGMPILQILDVAVKDAKQEARDESYESIKELIDELFTKAQTEGEKEVFDGYHDKFTDIIKYEDKNRSYYGSYNDFKEITIKLKNFIGALISDSDILTTDKTDFETAFESLLEDMMEQADLPSSYDELSERVREGGNMNVDTDKIVQRIKDNIYEIIDEKIYDDDEDYDADEIENLKNLKYEILTAFEKTLKGLGQDENVNEIENELVRIVFDRSKLKTNGSIYTSVIHKQDNSTYNGYMFIKDIPSYFKNYKLFEVLKNFKKLIK
jgi:hypothetical protein